MRLLPKPQRSWLHCRREQAGTTWHYSASAQMGSGPDAVLDPRLRVRGVANLRVADASVMPTVLSANLNCSSMMIGHHAVSAGPVGNL